MCSRQAGPSDWHDVSVRAPTNYYLLDRQNTVVQVHRESYHGTSAQIFHLGYIHSDPICPILLVAIRHSSNTRAYRHTPSRVDMCTSHTPMTSLRL